MRISAVPQYNFYQNNKYCKPSLQIAGCVNLNPSFGIANAGKLKTLFTYGVPCMYSGIEMIDPPRVQKLMKYDAFKRPISEVLKIFENYEKYSIYGYKHDGYSKVIDSVDSYFEANLDLLCREVRQDVFNRENPVYTNSRDDMPARYGLESKVKNSIIADGCTIEGTVKNSVLFRGVKVGKGATVENCVLMHGTEIGDGAKVKNIIANTFVKIAEDKVSEQGAVYIDK